MKRILERFFLIQPAELPKVFHAFLLLFLLSGNLLVIRAVSNALFLSRDSVAGLPLMYVGIAIGMALASAGYAALAARFPVDRVMYALFGAGGAILAVLFGLSIQPAAWFFGCLYITGAVVTELNMLQGWTFVGEVFNPREAKRLFGVLVLGGTLAGILSGFGVTWYTRHFPVNTLILVCAALALAAIPVTNALKRRGGYAFAARPRRGGAARPAGGFRDPYLVTILLITAATAAAVACGDYIFNMQARQVYRDKADLAAFIGLFYGVMNVGVLVYSLFLASRAVGALGVRGASLVMPAEIGASALLFVFHPGLAAAVLMKFGGTGINYTIHNATSQMLFLPLDKAVRARFKTLAGGVVKPAAAGVAGLALWLMGRYAGVESLGVYAAVLAVLCGLWVLVTWPLKKGYRGALYQALAGRGIDRDDLAGALHDRDTLAALEKELDSADPHHVVYALELLEELGAPGLGPIYIRALAGGHAEVVRHVVPRIEAAPRPGYAPALKELLGRHPGLDGAILRALAACGAGSELIAVRMETGPDRTDAVIAAILHLEGGPQRRAMEICHAMIVSTDPAERREAARVVALAGLRACSEAAGMLARAADPVLRRAVVLAAARDGDAAHWPLVRAGLDDPAVAATVVAVIARFDGMDASLAAETVLSRDGMRALATALGRLPTRISVDRLVRLLEDPDPGLRLAAARSLDRIGAGPGSPAPAADALDRAVTAAIRDLFPLTAPWPGGAAQAAVVGAVRRDRLIALFLLLGVRYGREEMRAACDHLTHGGNQAMALELIDTRVTGPEKAALIRLLETPPAGMGDAHREVYGTPLPDPVAAAAGQEDEVLAGLAAVARGPAASAQFVKGTTMLSPIERVIFLKGVAIFHELSGEYLMHLARAARETAFAPGGAICRDGAPERSLFVIVTGTVRVSKEGREVAVLCPAECIGEMALLDGKPRSADVTAVTAATCLEIDYDEFHDLVAANADMARSIFSVLTARIRGMLGAAHKG
ncbi:MAG: cyclic nucleotide-binding domain-containing protein [Planctomycetota bacterium]